MNDIIVDNVVCAHVLHEVAHFLSVVMLVDIVGGMSCLGSGG
jgi:hypothetical protein